jgi:molybdopterin-guanine dinucleotide biosynthesis protein A
VGDATNVRAAVLAGGAASRFGGAPKGLERVGGERILDRVAAAAYTAVGAPPLLIANAADAQSWRPDLTVVPDARHGCGSIGGIYTAVTAGEGPVLVVAWDMPFVPEDLLIALVQGAAGCDVFLPESGGRRGVEPLCGVYGPACEPAIRRRLDDEDYRAIGFHEDVRVGTLPLDLVTRFGDPEHLFFNVNTAEDLVRAEERWRQRA